MPTVTESGILVEPTTDDMAVGSIPDINVPRGQYATVLATGIAGAETFNVYVLDSKGAPSTLWTNGVEARITATINPISIGPGPVRVTFDKSETDNPVGLEVLL